MDIKGKEGTQSFVRSPALACCNFISDVTELKRFAVGNGFAGVDWSFTLDDFPRSPAEESDLVKRISELHPLQVRYHCAFNRLDLGDTDDGSAEVAMTTFRRACRIVSKVKGRILTIHVGLGQDSTDNLVWDKTIERLASLGQFANRLGVRLCLENLAWGWTSRPHLFEKIIRRAGCWATLDIGHAVVSPSVMTQHYELEDFVAPHAERFLNAHIYHEEEGDRHVPPADVSDLSDRLHLLLQLPLCDWWVLELREEQALLQTRDVVTRFLDSISEQGYPVS